MRQAEAGHFGKAAADQRRPRVLAEPLALDHAASDREHVLDRSADFRAGQIVGKIDAEGRLTDPLAKLLGQLRILCRQGHRGRQSLGDLVREGRPRQNCDLGVRAALFGDLVEQLAARLLDSLGAEDQRLVATARAFEHGAHVLRGSHHQPGVARIELAKVGGCPDRRAQRHAGEEQGILAL